MPTADYSRSNSRRVCVDGSTFVGCNEGGGKNKYQEDNQMRFSQRFVKKRHRLQLRLGFAT